MNKVSYQFLVVALVFQIGIFVSQSVAYSKIYTIFGMRMKWTRMFWVLLNSFFLTAIAPSGGFLIGMGVVMDDGRKMGLSKAKLLLANVVYWVVYYAVFIFFLLIGLFYLTVKNQVSDYFLLPAIIMLLAFIIFLTILITMLDSYDKFKNFSLRMAENINLLNKKLGRDFVLSPKSVKKYSFEVYEGYCFTVNNLFKLRGVVLNVLLMIVFNIAILSCLVWAFGGAWYSIGVLLATFVIAALLMVVSITPSGLGVVELAMTTILSAFLLPFEEAVMVVLLFRLYQFWLPVIAGFLTMQFKK